MGDRKLMTAQAWHASLGGHAMPRPRHDPGYRVLRFDDTPLDLVQPALLDDVICLHLGGAKRVQRTYAGRTVSYDVPEHALTLMPRWQENRWLTEGPNDYAHVVIAPRTLDAITTGEVGCTRDAYELDDDVGFTHPLAARLAEELIYLYRSPCEGRLYREGVFTAFVLALLRQRSSLRGPRGQRDGPPAGSGGGLAAWKLRRVTDYLQAHRSEDVCYDDLTALAGVSRSHFFRAFKNSTGMSPGRYLEQLRVTHARDALERGDPLDRAARHGGFNGTREMSRAFLRRIGITPTEYRRWYG